MKFKITGDIEKIVPIWSEKVSKKFHELDQHWTS